MDNPETPATLGTQDTGRKRTKQRNHNTTQKSRKYEQHGPHQYPRVDQNLEKMNNTDPIKILEWTNVFAKRKLSLLLIRNPSCYLFMYSPVRLLSAVEKRKRKIYIFI